MIKPQCIIRKDIRGNLKYEEVTQPEWPHELPGDHFTYEVITPAEDFKNEAALRKGLNFSFTNWDLEIEPTFTLAKNDEEATLQIAFVNAEDDPILKGSPSILAYAYFPGQGRDGIIVFNDDWFWQLGTKAGGISFIAVLTHEAGHSLGLEHSTRQLGLDLMDPFYNPDILTPSDYDVERLVNKYPVRKWIPRHYDRLKRWMKIRLGSF